MHEGAPGDLVQSKRKVARREGRDGIQNPPPSPAGSPERNRKDKRRAVVQRSGKAYSTAVQKYGSKPFCLDNYRSALVYEIHQDSSKSGHERISPFFSFLIIVKRYHTATSPGTGRTGRKSVLHSQPPLTRKRLQNQSSAIEDVRPYEWSAPAPAAIPDGCQLSEDDDPGNSKWRRFGRGMVGHRKL